MLFGHPWFDAQLSAYASSSLVYPIWNVIWAFLGGQVWIQWIPAVHAMLISATFAIVCFRLVQWFPNAPLGIFLPSFFSLALYLSQPSFLLQSFGGSEFILLQFGLVITGIPGLEMSKRSPVFSWWLIFVKPEGWLAGLARFLSALAFHKDVSNRRSSIFWATMALMLFLMAGVSLFDDAFPLDGISFWNGKPILSSPLAEKMMLIGSVGLSVFAAAVLLWRKKEFRNPLISPLILLGFLGFLGVLFKAPPEKICLAILPVSSFLLGFGLMVTASKLESTLGPKATILGFTLPVLIVCTGLFFIQWCKTKEELSKLNIESQKMDLRAEKIADQINLQVPSDKKIWSRKVGRLGWYAPFHSFVDLEGKTAPALSGFLREKGGKSFSERHLDSLILDRFSPDFLILGQQDNHIFSQIITFQMQYVQAVSFPPVPGEISEDTLRLWQRLNDYPLN